MFTPRPHALRAMGVTVVQDGPGVWHVDGVGVAGLHAPDDVLDLGNSGTSARLLCGLLAGHGFTAIMTGDGSLRKRPMNRVIAPLTEMGVRVETREGGRMPMSFTGSDTLLPIEYTLPVPSAQVKSAVLLAGLHAPGKTTVIEACRHPRPHRAHAQPYGRGDRDHGNARRPPDHDHRSDRAFTGQRKSAVRSQLGRLPGRRGRDRAGLRSPAERDRHEPGPGGRLRPRFQKWAQTSPQPTNVTKAASLLPI